jgi:hypothetical protein
MLSALFTHTSLSPYKIYIYEFMISYSNADNVMIIGYYMNWSGTRTMGCKYSSFFQLKKTVRVPSPLPFPTHWSSPRHPSAPNRSCTVIQRSQAPLCLIACANNMPGRILLPAPTNGMYSKSSPLKSIVLRSNRYTPTCS